MRAKWHSALIVSVTYIIFGSLWIILTDWLVDRYFDNFIFYSTVKGLLFVLLSSIVIYLSVYHQIKQHRELERIIDVELKKKASYKKTLEEQNKRLFKLIDESPVPMILHAENKRILRLSKTFIERTKYTYDDIPTVNAWVKKAYRDHGPKVLTHIDSLYTISSKLYEGTFSLKTKDDRTLIWDFYSSYIGRDEQGLRNIISIAIDITDYKQNESDLKFLSYHDDLTNTYNSRFLKKHIEELGDETFVALLADIDGLNDINKEYGRYKGDAVLKLFASLLKSHLPKTSIVARVGGDEFAAIIKQTTLEETKEYLKNIKEELKLVTFDNIKIDASFASALKDSDSNFDDIISQLEHSIISKRKARS
ncbi:MAG: diguanylate cyclase domain-containing protein [Candidatus Izemoplasmataceae bacterium]